MQRVNAEYASRVTRILNKAICSLKNYTEDKDTAVGDSAHRSNLVSGIEALREEISDTLSLTLDQAESLRSDVCRFDCERSTKNDDLVKFQTKLREMREERKERRDELENELAKLKQRFKEKEDVMAEEHGQKEEELFELKVEREAFGEEMKSWQEKKDRVSKQYEEQRAETAEARNAKTTNIESIGSQLEQHTRHCFELEERFNGVDRYSVIKKQKEEQLRTVNELEEQVTVLLGKGVVGLQKLWQGGKERQLVAKMKSKKKKKGGKSKKKKKKK